jgi:hypothetical protein
MEQSEVNPFHTALEVEVCKRRRPGALSYNSTTFCNSELITVYKRFPS